LHERLVPGLVVATTLDRDVRTVTFANGMVIHERTNFTNINRISALRIAEVDRSRLMLPRDTAHETNGRNEENMIGTLVYRGEAIGRVELALRSASDGSGRPNLLESAEWYTGVLEPLEAYARVRPEIRRLSIALDATAGMSAESIRELLLTSKRRHAENGMELQDLSGRPVATLDITVLDYGTDAGPRPNTPFVSVGVLIPRSL
jgi:hypothetical protein